MSAKTNRFYNGDLLEILPTISTCSVDLIVADPPYLVTVNSNINGKVNPWADMMNAAYWFSAWIMQCRRVLKPSGALWTFLNWKSLPILQKAALGIPWLIDSVLVWDKEWIGPGGTVGLRPSYELVALFPNEEFQIKDRGIADIKRIKWHSHKPTGHAAEKPIALVQWLIEISTDAGAVILDPFMGSGTTGAAAAAIGREFIGIEIDRYWFEYAERRVNTAQVALL